MMEGCLSTEEPSVQSGGVHLYSMQDLIETENGSLPKYLQEKLDVFVNHIKKDCQVSENCCRRPRYARTINVSADKIATKTFNFVKSSSYLELCHLYYSLFKGT